MFLLSLWLEFSDELTRVNFSVLGFSFYLGKSKNIKNCMQDQVEGKFSWRLEHHFEGYNSKLLKSKKKENLVELSLSPSSLSITLLFLANIFNANNIVLVVVNDSYHHY